MQGELVFGPAVHVDEPQLAQVVGVALNHSHWIPFHPALPNIPAKFAGLEIEGQVDTDVWGVWVGRVMGGHREKVQRLLPFLAMAVIVAPKLIEPGPRSARLAELIKRLAGIWDVTEFEVRIPGVVCDRLEHVRMPHAQNNGPVAARRFAEDTPMAGAVCGGNVRHDLIEQVLLVAPRGGRIDVLIAAQAGETIGRGDNNGWALTSRNEPIEAPLQIFSKRT